MTHRRVGFPIFSPFIFAFSHSRFVILHDALAFNSSSVVGAAHNAAEGCPLLQLHTFAHTFDDTDSWPRALFSLPFPRYFLLN